MMQAARGRSARLTVKPLRDAVVLIFFLAIAGTVNISIDSPQAETKRPAQQAAYESILFPAVEAVEAAKSSVDNNLQEKVRSGELDRTIEELIQRLEQRQASRERIAVSEDPCRIS